MTTVGAGKTHLRTCPRFCETSRPGDFAIVSTVATDSQDRLYVFQRKDPPVVVFDSDGNYLDAWDTARSTRHTA